LCRYWNERKKTFKERAFLPLQSSLHNLSVSSSVASGSATASALTEGDAAEFNQDLFFSFLPPDVQGCPVLYYDKTLTVNRGILSHVRAQHDSDSPTSQRARLLFAGCQKLAASVTSSTDGYVFVLRVDPTESVLALRFHKAHLELGTLLAQVFPLKLKAWHVVVVLPSSSEPVPSVAGLSAAAASTAASTLETTTNTDASSPLDLAAWIQQALPVLLLRWEAILGKPVQHIHAGTDEASVITSLRQHGLRLDRLPPTDNITWPALLRGASLATASVNDQDSNETASGTKKREGLPTDSVPNKRQFNPQPEPQRNAASPHSSSSIPSSHPLTVNADRPPIDVAQVTTTTDPTWHQSAVKEAEDSGVLDDETMQSKGLQQLAEAVRFLPEHQTTAYRQAQEVCPELVEKESHPLRFLR
jgi:hypothetical protein